ncbi:hypothetical protein [Caulobacter sp. RL271]|jgi:uncharacterized membrane protein YadS|uniref:GGDEF domain-containing protein n=1 Tax=Caulobacter segnis TaxID=88688 RepID=A0ABY4ZVX2_9CAUL|nr:hypothetical protein [Caulobacter segnis]USQ96901.1 hypothetical protein MZV50_04855 [Caulobacter segnis]
MFAYLQLLFLVDWLLIAVACFGAWRWGARQERHAAALVLAIFVGFILASLIRDKEFIRGVYLTLDGLLALGLLLLSLRYATRWLGVTVLLQGVQFSLHAYYLVAARRYDNFYILVNNLVSLGVLICLLTGVALAWRARRRAAK